MLKSDPVFTKDTGKLVVQRLSRAYEAANKEDKDALKKIYSNDTVVIAAGVPTVYGNEGKELK